jgi:hypothetical protein
LILSEAAMTEFPEIEGILSAAFSIETGLSDHAATGLLRRALESQEWRNRFQAELIRAFSTPGTPWKTLLSNDRYEVFDPGTDAEARDFIANTLWEPTFPGRAAPATPE